MEPVTTIAPDDTPDPNDLVVGTITAPSSLSRIPRLAWLFVALAAFDAIYQVWTRWTSSGDMSPLDVAYLVTIVVGGVATVLLPAAVLIGRQDSGPGRSWIFQGAVAIAAAELIRLVLPDVIRALAPQSVPDSFVSDVILRALAVQLPVIVLLVFGLAKIGLGLGALESAVRPLGRGLPIVLIAGLVLIAASDAQALQSMLSTPGDRIDFTVLAYNVFIVAGAIVVAGLWSWVVTVAARRDGRSWRTIELGAFGVVLGYVGYSAASILAFSRAGTGDAQMILNWVGLAASIVGAAGATVLAVGFAMGPGPVDQLDHPEAASDERAETVPAIDSP